MTATPITDSPEELFEIVNTLIPDADNRFGSLAEFREKYTDADGGITEAGKKYYKSRANGIVSYLNREFDPTTFAQANFHTVAVPIVETGVVDIPAFIDDYMKKVGIDTLISEAITERDCDATLRAEQKVIDGRITDIETQLADKGLKNKTRKAALRSEILDLKQLMKDAELKHKTRRKRCEVTNKAIAKASAKSRKSFRLVLLKDMEEKYKKTLKNRTGQMKDLENCLGYKGSAGDGGQFMKVAKEIFKMD
jgi:hypothetical protein